MKRLVIAFALVIGLGGNALAEDSYLRLPTGLEPEHPTYWNWSGIYIGGHVSYSSANADLSNATRDQVKYILRETILEPPVSAWSVLGNANATDINFGGFVGFNTQWENAIVGLEANYSRTNMDMSSTGSVGPLLISDNTGAPEGHDYAYSVTVTSSASVKITDTLTMRARGGWAAGPFLPYGFVGAALGRANIARTTTISAILRDSYTVPTPFIDPVTGTITIIDVPTVDFIPLTFAGNPQQDSRDGVVVFGFAAGLGVDIALMDNVFVRGEWEYLVFPSISSTIVSINSFRAGVGVKF